MPRGIDRTGLLAGLLALLLVSMAAWSIIDNQRPKIIACNPPNCYFLQMDQPPPPPRKRGTEA